MQSDPFVALLAEVQGLRCFQGTTDSLSSWFKMSTACSLTLEIPTATGASALLQKVPQNNERSQHLQSSHALRQFAFILSCMFKFWPVHHGYMQVKEHSEQVYIAIMEHMGFMMMTPG